MAGWSRLSECEIISPVRKLRYALLESFVNSRETCKTRLEAAPVDGTHSLRQHPFSITNSSAFSKGRPTKRPLILFALSSVRACSWANLQPCNCKHQLSSSLQTAQPCLAQLSRISKLQVIQNPPHHKPWRTTTPTTARPPTVHRLAAIPFSPNPHLVTPTPAKVRDFPPSHQLTQHNTTLICALHPSSHNSSTLFQVKTWSPPLTPLTLFRCPNGRRHFQRACD